MGKTVDKRIVKTMRAIRSSFIELVQEKNFAEISISELTKKAGITRSTFYMYYGSVSAVRAEIEDEILKSLEKFMAGKSIEQVLIDPYPFLKALSDKIMSYDEMNRYLVCATDSGQLLDKLRDYAADIFVKLVSDEKPEEKIRARYTITFLCAGILGAYRVWFLNRDSISLEEMCKHFSDIILDCAAMFEGK